MHTERVTFEVDDNQLTGLLDVPIDQNAHALIILVHGYGATNVVEQNWYYKLRSRFAKHGIASFVWDKPGSGASEGDFDINQPVQSSAEEVIAAATMLRARGVPGAENMGLWGLSRAGWIAPLALAQDPNLAFWVSVSGVDALENFSYLLASNWAIKGYEQSQIDHLVAQWKRGIQIMAEGSSYANYLAATEDFRADPFAQSVIDGNAILSEMAFLRQQTEWQQSPPQFETDTGLQIHIEAFDQLLSRIHVPVLAIFGENDTSVNWHSTKALYERTIGKNPNASLTIKTFPTGNHNLHQSETGGFEEMLENINDAQVVDGYYDIILSWLNELNADQP